MEVVVIPLELRHFHPLKLVIVSVANLNYSVRCTPRFAAGSKLSPWQTHEISRFGT